jgi:hypothetical protein
MSKIGILQVKKLVDSLINFVIEDYNEKKLLQSEVVLPSTLNYLKDSFIYRCFDEEDVDEGINYRDSAVELFLRTQFDSRRLETRVMFDRDRATLPTIHVREPAKLKGNSDAIGYTSEQLFFNDLVHDLESEEEPIQTFNYKVRRSFNSQFELMITSVNRHEVLIIEEVIMALLMGAQDTISLVLPFQTVQLSVKEIIYNSEITPNMFIKSIMLNVNYEKIYPELADNELLNKILFEHELLTS